MKTSKAVPIALLACSLAALPAAKHIPLAPQVLSAKTVYIDNHTGDQKVADQAYQELQKWGRFEVVSDVTKADLVLYFGNRGERRGLLVMDPQSAAILWSGQRMRTQMLGIYPIPTRAMHNLLSDFRKRVEEQSKK